MKLLPSTDNTLPEEKGATQELSGADVFQRKLRVDDQEQNAEDGYQLQPLQARLQARQRPRARLLQPIGISLETEERTFGGGVKA